MDRTELVDLLCDLKCENLKEYEDEDFLNNKIKTTCEKLGITDEDVKSSLCEITNQYFSENESIEWKYICLNLYIIQSLKEILSNSTDILSVQQSKTVKICLKDVVAIGILKNLQPNMPFYMKSEKNNEDIILVYNILKYTSFAFYTFLKQSELRLLILPDSLQAILIAVYQISYCTLMKPGKSTNSGFVMTEELYNKLLSDKEQFKVILEDLSITIHPAIFVKETMIIFQENSPLWFKKAVSQTLTKVMRSKNGVESIASALLDGVTDDSTKTWKSLEVITKLLLSCRNLPDFRDNIAKQIISLLDMVNGTDFLFERIFTHFTKTLYTLDSDLCKDIFVRRVVNPFLYYTCKEYKVNDGEDITQKLQQNVRLLHDLFHLSSGGTKKLPLDILRPILNVIFRFYSCTYRSKFKTVNNELKDILLNAFKSNSDKLFDLFDSFIFNFSLTDVMLFRNDVIICLEEDSIILTSSDHAVSYPVSDNAECTLEILKNQVDLLVVLFGYLLTCLTEKEKYFRKFNEVLLNAEDQFMNDYFERSLTVYKLLSDLSNDERIQKSVTKDPDNILKYIKDVLEKTIELKTHKTTDFDCEGFQSVFTIIMILQSLVSNGQKLDKHKVLFEPLKKISEECSNKELKDLIGSVLDNFESDKPKTTRYKVEEEKSDLNKALDDICDPLLPVRGHGLMILAKLVGKKDKNTLQRKQYILNIFQQNLKNEDSFIYLRAIEGLAAMADVFPDTVINILCEEYSDFSKKEGEDGHEVRIKLGEVLVRVTKVLGNMAPKYKSLLLNTFLNGVKDDDHLIRASSLSNLGEICRVLGYKLGTIVTEVLVCVHAVITTDKAIEARRAAVTVIRQLFLGLDSEMIAFLKDDILPIYRTLKRIYNDDKDDVMRLQAQLALEELNENMRNFVFPKPQMHMEKKIIMLD